MNEIIVPGKQVRGGALAVISTALGHGAGDLAIAQRCAEWKDTLPIVRDLASARMVRATLLPMIEQIHSAWVSLCDMTSDTPPQPITHAEALRMLGAFDALAKRAAPGEMASLIGACAAMVSGTDAALADLIGVEPLPRHPMVFALAIKRVLNTATYRPVPLELRCAMLEVRRRLRVLRSDAWAVLEIARKAERIVFREDREAWLLPYASGEMPISHAVSIVDDADDAWASAVNDLIPDE